MYMLTPLILSQCGSYKCKESLVENFLEAACLLTLPKISGFFFFFYSVWQIGGSHRILCLKRVS